MQMNKLRAVVSYLFPLGAQTLFNMQGNSFLALEKQEGRVMKHTYCARSL